MENATRWIFSLAMTVLLLYACMHFAATYLRLTAAREELDTLKETQQALREENKTLSQMLDAAAGENGFD